MKQKNIWVSGIAVLGLWITAAQADDVVQAGKGDLQGAIVTPAADEEATVFDWSGLYMGVSAGWSLANVEHYYDRQNGNNDHGQVWINANGYNVAGFFGYNHMLSNNFVIGAEAELGFLGLDEEEIVIKDDDVLRIDTGLFGTARLRAGYAFDRFMPYVTGGVGFVDIENNGGNPANAARYNVNQDVQFALAVGAGVDYAFTDYLIGRLEYLHLNTPKYWDRNLENEAMAWDNDINLIRAAISYKLN